MPGYPRRRKSKVTPEQRAHKYQCRHGHIRIEKEFLKTLPECPACDQAGQKSLLQYIGKYTIPKTQLKKSKFK